MRRRKVILSIQYVVVAAAAGVSMRAMPALGQTEWTAGIDNWYTNTNWTNSAPAADTSTGNDAYIGNGGTAQIASGSAAVGNLFLGQHIVNGPAQSGAVAISGTGTLTAYSVNIGLSGTGSFTQSGGTVSITGSSLLSSPDGLAIGINNNNALLPISTPSPGSYTLSGGSLVVTAIEAIGDSGVGIFTQTGGDNKGALFISRHANGNGTYNMSGGTFEGGIEMGDPFYQNEVGTFNLSGTGTVTSINGESMSGTIAGTPSEFNQTGGTNITRDLNIGGNSGRTFGAYSISSGTLSDTGAMSIGMTSGTFTDTGGTATVASVSNYGTLTVGNGVNTAASLTVTGNYVQNAGVTDVDGTLVVSGAGGITLNGSPSSQSFLKGIGTIAGSVSNVSGIVSPGDPLGELTVNGNYTQATAGVMSILIDGATASTQYGVLNLSGSATLGGTLDLTFDGSFNPFRGETFTFLTTGGNDIGQFATVNSNIPIQVNYFTNGASVTVLPEPSVLAALGLGAGLLVRPKRRSKTQR